MDTLCFSTCGGTDVGKTTLISRLHAECSPLDELQRVHEQTSSSEVNYRLFATEQRHFKVADIPGIELHTRNLTSSATTASLALVVVDACIGLQTQTRSHCRILAMMGIRHVVLAVNKMDLADFNEAAFNTIVAEFDRFSNALGFVSFQAIPLSALAGDNVSQLSKNTPWYSGPTLLQYLNTVETQCRPLVETNGPAEMADQFEAKLLWMSEHALAPGRLYLMKTFDKKVSVSITDIKYRVEVDQGAQLATKVLKHNDIAVVNVSTSAPLLFVPHAADPTLSRFTLLDLQTLETVGTGNINFALRRASNIHWQALEINKAARASLQQQTPRCIWYTGLSGSGKSTIANMLEKRLYADGRHTYLLDGDNVRHGLNRNLGFTEADRVENIRRVAEVARLMVDAGLIVLVSFISPFAAERAMARSLFAEGEFVEVFVDSPIEACERRDVKGLYAKARKGELKNFTGIDSPYEVPTQPDIHLLTAEMSPEQCVEQMLASLGMDSSKGR